MSADSMRPFNIFDPLRSGKIVLEASAGTGKTWTIAALATRLIAETDTSVSELLIITFTRAAATELRSRVRARFIEVADGLDAASGEGRLSVDDDPVLYFLATGGAPQDDQSPVFLDAEVLAERAAKLRLAAAEIDTATITTIHSFFQTALQRFGITGDIATDRPLVNNVDDLVAEAWVETYLEIFIDAPEPGFTHEYAKDLAVAVTNNPSASMYPPERAGEAAETTVRREFGQKVRERLRRRKLSYGVVGFNDLLELMAEIVDPSDPAKAARANAARELLRQQWRHVFVDEFQDTDDIQWRVLRAVFAGEGNLTLIGDPKQAIYTFRGGDLQTYLDATHTADTRETLTHNYRADPKLLDAVNTLLEGADFGDPRITLPLVSSGVKAPRVVLPEGEDDQRLRLRVVDRDKVALTKQGYGAMDDVRGAIANDVARDIAELLAGRTQVRWREGEFRNVQAGDVAVLCHSRKEARHIQGVLLRLGINAVISGGVSVFEAPAVDDWLILLRAMDHLSNRRYLAAAALGPFFGYRGRELTEERDAVLEHVSETLRGWSRALTSEGVASVFEQALGGENEGMAVRVLGHAGGERLLTDLRHISELLHAAHPRAGAHTLFGWLQSERENPDSGEHPRRLESDASAVQISTLHAAKGLEFPFVYLPTTPTESTRMIGISVAHMDGERVIVIEPKEGRKDSAALTQAKKEMAGERSRLLYVGLTRGIGQVTAYWAPMAGKAQAIVRLLQKRVGVLNQKSPAVKIVEQLQEGLGPKVHVEIMTDSPAQPLEPVQSEPVGHAKEWTRAIDRAWRRSSYTSLAAAAERSAAFAAIEDEWEFKEDPASLDIPEVDPPADETASDAHAHLPSPMADLPGGAHFGSLVHAILETVDTRAEDLPAEVDRRIREELRHWPQDLDEEVLREAILAVLTTPLHPAVPDTLTDIDPARKLAELDFEIPLDGGIHARSETRLRLGEMAEILRRHLPPGDPLYSYAAVLESPAYDAQVLRGYLTGSIDLVFGRGEKYFVADYKTNWLGPYGEPLTTATYDRAHVNEAMEGSSYPLQALLYTVALHRYLRWRLPGYDPAHHLGGVLYLYVRGMAGPATPVVDGHSSGIFYWAPPPALVVELSDLLDGT